VLFFFIPMHYPNNPGLFQIICSTCSSVLAISVPTRQALLKQKQEVHLDPRTLGSAVAGTLPHWPIDLPSFLCFSPWLLHCPPLFQQESLWDPVRLTEGP
jgi:hypothetical protein